MKYDRFHEIYSQSQLLYEFLELVFFDLGVVGGDLVIWHFWQMDWDRLAIAAAFRTGSSHPRRLEAIMCGPGCLSLQQISDMTPSSPALSALQHTHTHTRTPTIRLCNCHEVCVIHQTCISSVPHLQNVLFIKLILLFATYTVCVLLISLVITANVGIPILNAYI